MRNIIAFPFIGLAVILQSSMVGQIKLLSGYADLPLLLLAAWALQDRVKSAWHWSVVTCVMVGFVSRMPWPVYVVGYGAVVFIAQVLQRRVWQAPLLAMFSVTFAGALFMNLISFVVLQILGTPLLLGEVVGLITLPSVLLNMLFAIPVYTVMRDLARWVYPSEEYE
jgi:rod shape-determining protein MreD